MGKIQMGRKRQLALVVARPPSRHSPLSSLGGNGQSLWRMAQMPLASQVLIGQWPARQLPFGKLTSNRHRSREDGQFMSQRFTYRCFGVVDGDGYPPEI